MDIQFSKFCQVRFVWDLTGTIALPESALPCFSVKVKHTNLQVILFELSPIVRQRKLWTIFAMLRGIQCNTYALRILVIVIANKISHLIGVEDCATTR